jgi:S-sulfo-L-cysteine synthase (O-acetyl-L-serine-dependent)
MIGNHLTRGGLCYEVNMAEVRNMTARPSKVKTKQARLNQSARTMEQLIGNTPLLAFPRLTAHLAPGVALYAKAEWANPGGSIKDRPALNIIRQAEKRGDLKPGMVLLDSTSGNMGIAYAMLGAARGYKVKLVLPANASPERIAILRTYGVELVLSDPADGSDGAIRKVREINAAEPERYFFANQYNNPDNWKAHYKTTGVEIWEQTAGKVTHLVVGLGTSGTLMGTGRRLREYNPDVRLIAFQPDSPFHGLEGLKHMPTAIKPGIYDETIPDEQTVIHTEDAHAMCRRLAREEGVLVGISAGAALAGALKVAETLTEGVVVTVLPDSAAKYLSEPFWAEGV